MAHKKKLNQLFFSTVLLLTSQLNANDSINKIIGGHVPLGDDPSLTSTVAYTEFRQTNCSGVIVSEDIMLTAAHCVLSDVGYEHFNEIIFSPDVKVFDVDRDIRQVVEIKVHPDYKFMRLQNDIAWVRFKGGLPEGFVPAKIMANQDRLVAGLPLRLAGYGLELDSGLGFPIGRRNVVDTVLREYHIDVPYPGIIFYGPTPMQGACGGDSGGPAYAKFDDVWHVVGVTIGPDQVIAGVNDCNSGQGMYTQIGRHLEWLESSSGEKFSVTY